MIHRAAASGLSRLLENGAPERSVRRALSMAWSAAARPVRPVPLPVNARVIGVGGATLGGSYKTPFVLALATLLATRRRAISLAVHGYGARISEPRRVTRSDDVRDVGDEALYLARELDPFDVPVVVGKPWSAAIALAARHAPTVLADGLLQTRPRRVDRSFLVVDGGHAWRSGRCPPAGDLRASPSALGAALDEVIEVVDRVAVADVSSGRGGPSEHAHPSFRAVSDILGVRRPRSETLPLDAVANLRVGLLVAIARPDRVLGALAARGIRPVEVRMFGDHRALPERPWFVRRPAHVELWITTGKCATKLGAAYEGMPVWTLEHRLWLSPALGDCVDRP